MPEPTTSESRPVPLQTAPERGPSGAGLSRRLRVVAGELALIAGFWLLLKFGFGIIFDWRLVVALAAAVLVGGIVPERFGPLATGLGILGVAALEFFYYANMLLAAVLGVFAAVNLFSGFGRLSQHRG